MAQFPHYKDFTDYSPVVPEIYWNVYTPEQRIKYLCKEYAKLAGFTDSMVDTVNDQYAIIEDMQEKLPELVDEATIELLTSWINDGTLKGLLGMYYVTPEQYGAKGDGETDDTDAFQAACNSGYTVRMFSDSTYLLNGSVALTANTYIEGNNATVNISGDANYGLLLQGNNIKIANLNIIGADNYSCISTSANITDVEYIYENITIENCDIKGGHFGIYLDTTRNISVTGCTIHEQEYDPDSLIAGYGILLQSCHDVGITGCWFAHGETGRHNIYVSINQTKTEYYACSNVVITNCMFDNRNQGSSPRVTNTSVPINVREVTNFILSNSTFKNCSGCVTFTRSLGATSNALISGITAVNPIYDSTPSSTKSYVNIATSNINVKLANSTFGAVATSFNCASIAADSYMSINNCNFEDGKILVYTDTINITNCTFNASSPIAIYSEVNAGVVSNNYVNGSYLFIFRTDITDTPYIAANVVRGMFNYYISTTGDVVSNSKLQAPTVEHTSGTSSYTLTWQNIKFTNNIYPTLNVPTDTGFARIKDVGDYSLSIYTYDGTPTLAQKPFVINGFSANS